MRPTWLATLMFLPSDRFEALHGDRKGQHPHERLCWRICFTWPLEAPGPGDVPANRISQVVAGKRNISSDTALRLGKLLSTGPLFGLNLQMAYELDSIKASGGPDLANNVPLIQPIDHSVGRQP